MCLLYPPSPHIHHTLTYSLLSLSPRRVTCKGIKVPEISGCLFTLPIPARISISLSFFISVLHVYMPPLLMSWINGHRYTTVPPPSYLHVVSVTVHSCVVSDLTQSVAV
ncbi:hypothetical protein FKM82_030995 [Ascaphus truei]